MRSSIKCLILPIVSQQVQEYLSSPLLAPLLVRGDALEVLKTIPDNSIDCCITSPPYWGMREYSAGGIGLEGAYEQYIASLLAIVLEVKRVLKNTGSFWLNIGDSYHNKRLVGIPWRVAIQMMDTQGWILRNEVIWNKVKGGPDNAKDKLGNVHEQVFHFVKTAKGYYYDADSIRKTPSKSKVINGAVVSATGVSGVRYKRQIQLSTSLTDEQKKAALLALDKVLTNIVDGELSDFRMIIKGVQRATHSDSQKLSGRAKELSEKGFYFLKYHKNGSKPRDVWDILPEDTQKRNGHFAAYPEDLCHIPLLATCPENGIVLDPFVGTGTTVVVARNLGRKSIGVDLSQEYIDISKKRLDNTLP